MSSGNRVQELLDELHAMITEAWGIPLGAEKCVIERGKALDLLDDVLTQFPQELAEAKRLVEARAEFIGNAKREAEAVRKAAEDRARQLVDEQEILRIAQARSTELVTTAERTSAELRRAANEYIDDALRQTEEVLSSALTEMQQSRSRLRDASQ
ncbi:MAG: hypothetical protein LBS51_00600 [Oscillospiraceae bacterium]|jgi:cell division septum initiation protein DivIVA|nr:hypothetical protein [Oscillospiraceae bacterium]